MLHSSWNTLFAVLDYFRHFKLLVVVCHVPLLHPCWCGLPPTTSSTVFKCVASRFSPLDGHTFILVYFIVLAVSFMPHFRTVLAPRLLIRAVVFFHTSFMFGCLGLLFNKWWYKTRGFYGTKNTDLAVCLFSVGPAFVCGCSFWSSHVIIINNYISLLWCSTNANPSDSVVFGLNISGLCVCCIIIVALASHSLTALTCVGIAYIY